MWVRGLYRYIDYEDKDPYLSDTTGKVHVISGSLGLTF